MLNCFSVQSGDSLCCICLRRWRRVVEAQKL